MKLLLMKTSSRWRIFHIIYSRAMKEKRSLLILLDLHSIQDFFHLRIPLTLSKMARKRFFQSQIYEIFENKKKADQQYEVVERITTIEDENGEIMQKTNQVYIGFPRVPRWYNSDSLPKMPWICLDCSTVRPYGNLNNLFSKCPFNFVEISITFTSIPATRRFPLVKISISSSNIWSKILQQKK